MKENEKDLVENVVAEPEGAVEQVAEAVEPVAEEAVEAETADVAERANIDLAAIARQDARLGHVIVDMLSGGDVEASVKRNFGLECKEADVVAAEHRGYVKARNEIAEREMQRKGVWDSSPVAEDDEPELGFLNYIRPSVWD